MSDLLDGEKVSLLRSVYRAGYARGALDATVTALAAFELEELCARVMRALGISVRDARAIVDAGRTEIEHELGELPPDEHRALVALRTLALLERGVARRQRRKAAA